MNPQFLVRRIGSWQNSDMRIAVLLTFCSLALPAQTISVAQLNLWDDEPQKTLAQLWGAAAENPKSATARVNVSYAFLSQNRLQQAEWTARESLKLEPANPQAQLILGWTLAREYRYTAEALDCLRSAAKVYPVAHLGAADVLAHQGSPTEARSELQAYLVSGAKDYHSAAENWLKLLAAN
jgi:tetratricopeptide (TPR) repeat protein